VRLRSVIFVASTAALLCGCVTPPMGPTVPVMPGPNKNEAQFQQDDMNCQGFASNRVAGGAEAANNTAIGETLLGTALGAGIGAAAGGGRGAGVGAAAGAIVGSAVGSNTSANAQMGLQHRYDVAYAHCMASKGNRVDWGPPPPYGYGYPPPPPGAYPAPPGAYPPPPPAGE
jgi:hypothetical protein